jgi:hypothetical protein
MREVSDGAFQYDTCCRIDANFLFLLQVREVISQRPHDLIDQLDAKAFLPKLVELVNADDIFKEVNSYDKSIFEKLALVDQLEEKEKSAFFSILDALVSKKRLKDTLAHALNSI